MFEFDCFITTNLSNIARDATTLGGKRCASNLRAGLSFSARLPLERYVFRSDPASGLPAATSAKLATKRAHNWPLTLVGVQALACWVKAAAPAASKQPEGWTPAKADRRANSTLVTRTMLRAHERRQRRAASHFARDPHAGAPVVADGFRSNTEHTPEYLLRSVCVMPSSLYTNSALLSTPRAAESELHSVSACAPTSCVPKKASLDTWYLQNAEKSRRCAGPARFGGRILRHLRPREPGFTCQFHGSGHGNEGLFHSRVGRKQARGAIGEERGRAAQ